jgi:translation initiation factor IF-2
LIPKVGKQFKTVSSKQEAENLAREHVEDNSRENKTIDEDVPTIPIVLKADVSGSLEALKKEIAKIKVDGAKKKILSEGIGPISENDVKIASASKNSIVAGFGVTVDSRAKAISERLSIEVKTFDIIYKLTEWLSLELEKRRPRKEIEQTVGQAKILKIFGSEKDRFIIGGRVENGNLKNGCQIKISRRDIEIGRGKIKSLQQVKNKIDEVKKDMEFGAVVETKTEPAPGDRIESFEIIQK